MVLHALIASLPYLKQGDAPSMTMEELLASADAFLNKKDSAIFRELTFSADSAKFPAKSLAAKYLAWETAFRNSIAKLRAARLNVDSAAYLRAEGKTELDSERLAREAFASENPLERERLLDAARWSRIEELEFGNLFNFNVLCAYKLKLELLLKWNARNAERSQKNLDLAAAEVRKEAIATN